MLAELAAVGRVAAADDASSRGGGGALLAHRHHRSRPGDRRRHAVRARRSDRRPPPARHAASRCAARRSGRGPARRRRTSRPTRPIARVAHARACATSRVELPPLLERDSPRRALGRRRRRARPEPAGGVHPSDRTGAARMIGTLLRIGWLNLKRDRVAQALTFLLPIVFFSIFAIGVRRPGRRRRPRASASRVVDEDRSELSRAPGRGAAQGDRPARADAPPTRTARAPPLDRARGGDDWSATATCRSPSSSRKASARRSRRAASAGGPGRRSSCSPTSPIRSRRRWCIGLLQKVDDDGRARPADAGRHGAVREVRRAR